MQRILVILLALALLSGCLGRKSDPDAEAGTESSTASATATDNATGASCAVTPCPNSGILQPKLQLLDCTTYFLFYPVDEQKVAAEMPDYEPVFDTPTAGLDALSAIPPSSTTQQSNGTSSCTPFQC